MTVKDLITRLLDCDINKEIYLSDNIEFENEYGKIIGSIYDITSIDEGGVVYLNFDNRNSKYKKDNK